MVVAGVGSGGGEKVGECAWYQDCDEFLWTTRSGRASICVDKEESRHVYLDFDQLGGGASAMQWRTRSCTSWACVGGMNTRRAKRTVDVNAIDAAIQVHHVLVMGHEADARRTFPAFLFLGLQALHGDSVSGWTFGSLCGDDGSLHQQNR